MKSKSLCYIQIDPETYEPVRIFRNTHDAMKCDSTVVAQMARSAAVHYIRLQVILRATRGKLIHCELCDSIVTSETGHMHEVVSKGNGGEVSLDNCRFICPRCHILAEDSEHGNRRFKSSKIKEE